MHVKNIINISINININIVNIKIIEVKFEEKIIGQSIIKHVRY